jgi:hypothetical protein
MSAGCSPVLTAPPVPTWPASFALPALLALLACLFGIVRLVWIGTISAGLALLVARIRPIVAGSPARL